MKSIWNGTIAFGEVTIPVGLAATVTGKGVSFATLHRECATPVQRKLVCAVHGDVPAEELVKGFEVAKGQYVLVEDAELEELAPEENRTIRISTCLAPGQLEPLAVERRYFLTPSESPLGRRPYLLLHQALQTTETVALARFVAFKSEWLATIRPLPGATRTLLLEKLSYADELVPATEIEQTLRAGQDPTVEELGLAAALVEQLRPFRPTRRLFLSDHRARVQALVEAKLAGAPLVQTQPAAEGPAQAQLPSVDLMDALRRSMKKQPRDRSGRPPRATARR